MTLLYAHGTCHHRAYLLDCNTYELLAVRSKGRCEMCGEEPRNGRLVIDHDHNLGSMAVRGLVCYGCNVTLGHVDAGRRREDNIVRRYFAAAFFLQLDEFKVYLGPGIHPDVASRMPRVEAALRRYLPAALNGASESPQQASEA